jgi:ABC-2 type transport system permease protein
MAILIALSRLLFGVPFHGSVTLLFALSALFFLTALGFGMLISTVAASQQVAWTICMLSTVLPSFLLSDFIFPIESMPVVVQAFTYIVPVRYFIVILRGIMLKGVGMESLVPQTTALAVFALVMVLVSSRRVARRLT